MYTDLYTRNQRPSWHPFLGVLAVLSIIGAGFIYTTKYSPSTRASQSTSLEHEIVNTSAKQVSIFWQTDESEQGSVLYGTTPDKLESIGLDDRDKSENRTKLKLHLVSLKNLQPNKEYFYKIVAGNTIYTQAEGKPYSFKTPNTVPPSSNAKPAYGKVSYASGKAVEGAIVKLFFEEGVPIYTVTKSSGEWLVPLQNVYSKNLTTTLQIGENTPVTIDVIAEDLSKTRIKSVMKKSSPLPQTIVLGTNYDFTQDENVLPAFTSRAAEETSDKEIDILFPRQDSVIPGFQPLIKGKGIPNQRVQLELNSRPVFRFSTRANEEGNWIVNVPRPLPPGEYSLTLLAKSSSNEDVVIVRSFTLAKSGEQVLAEATGPANLTPTVLPTEEPTATPEPSLDPSPTIEATASPTITASPSATIAATGSGTVVPTYFPITPAPPVTGTNGILYTVISIGLLVVGGGVMLLL